MNYDDGYCSDTAVGAIGRRRRGDACQNFTCMSPWHIVRRWITGPKSNGSSSGRNWGKRNSNPKTKLGFLNRLDVDNDEPPSSSTVDRVSDIGREASFNLGVGFGLIYLIAASRNELSKMVELQRQIEALLRNLNQDNPKPPLSLPPKSPNSSSSSIITEIQAEKTPITNQPDTQSEVQMRSEECAPEPAPAPEYYSVPARELERKLHELLEARQQERITELETTLDRAMLKLGEKEREVAWWKDTARLIAGNLPPIPNPPASKVKLQSINGGREITVREITTSMVMNSLFETKYETV
ncbi:protein POLAR LOCALIZATION DURING ASYMMETRIC DIVISION AND REDISTRIBUTION-like [Andrographis paniculata]|uniref:protein POLAR LOCALIZATION DURING ASYMMETRIC DIVISION AND REDISTRIBUTION-like n=1 Tax=Andrographis paniculata TaxID=175694 RepID=UPI0021E8389B|nr:protein POLAR LOCALIZATION DURING ASYMMETRIC DIVISION AND REDISTRIBUTION-like [Andrographis paniculata]